MLFRSPCQVFASPGRALLFLRCLTLQLVVEFCRGKGVIQVARVYRVDVSHLTAEQKREVDTKLRTVSFMVLNRMNKNGLLIAFDAIEEKLGDFTSLDDFKSALSLPEQCVLTDVTGWDLRP